MIGAGGAGERRLTTGGFYDDNPAWSPDGTRIVFQRQKGKQLSPELYTVKPDGANLKPLITAPGWNFAPDWAVGQNTTGPAAAPRLTGTVGPGSTITLRKSGRKVTKLKTGKYTLQIDDRSASLGYILRGPNGFAKRFTSAPFTGTATFALVLKNGEYSYYSRPGSTIPGNSFTVSLAPRPAGRYLRTETTIPRGPPSGRSSELIRSRHRLPAEAPPEQRFSAVGRRTTRPRARAHPDSARRGSRGSPR